MTPDSGDMKIMMTEKHQEDTDIRVALSAGGTMEFSSTSDLICIRSSAKAVMKPPAVIIQAIPVKLAAKPKMTTVKDNIKTLIMGQCFTLTDRKAPITPPMDIMKSKGPRIHSFIPVRGSLAWRKNSSGFTMRRSSV